MSARTLMALAVAAAALLLLAVLAQRDGGTPEQRSTLLLPGLAERLNDLERVAIMRAGNEPVATLERGPDGWSVAERQGYRADVGKLRQALVALGEARIVERKTANPELYDRLAVEDVGEAEAGGLAISFEAAGTQLPMLIVGDAEGSSHRYVRRADEAQSYLIDRNPSLPRNTSQWLDTAILDVRGSRVQQVTIRHPDGEVVRVFKDDPGQANYTVADVPEGRQLQYPGVANVIGNALRELGLEDVERADALPDVPMTATEFRTFDGLVVSIEGYKRDDAAWVTLAARFDPEQAARFEAAAADEEAPSAPAEEAAAIEARTQGWRYRIASYQYDQITRRLSDLLQTADE